MTTSLLSRSSESATPIAPLSWRIVWDRNREGAENMAIDQALADEHAPGSGVLRFYGWTRPTVSFGRNEPVQGVYDLGRAKALGFDVVRRPTGGRAVFHHRELTYTVVAPHKAFGGVRGAYRSINAALEAGLSSLGASVAQAPEGTPTLGPDAGACFAHPAAGELTAGARKLVGSAQARVGSAFLQHGSILIQADQYRLDEVRLAPSGEGGQPPAGLAELVRNVRPRDVANAVAEAMRSAFGGDWKDGALSESEKEIAGKLELERYRRVEWTMRR